MAFAEIDCGLFGAKLRALWTAGRLRRWGKRQFIVLLASASSAYCIPPIPMSEIIRALETVELNGPPEQS